MQAASTENTPHNKACGEGGRSKDAHKTGDKAQDGEKGGDNERNVKSQQMAQPWRGSGEGDKIRVQSRHVKQH